jgi:hypothetical protein
VPQPRVKLSVLHCVIPFIDRDIQKNVARIRQKIRGAKLLTIGRKFFRLLDFLATLAHAAPPTTKQNQQGQDRLRPNQTLTMSGPVYDLAFVPPDAFSGQLLDPDDMTRSCSHCGFGGCDVRVVSECGCVAHAVRTSFIRFEQPS